MKRWNKLVRWALIAVIALLYGLGCYKLGNSHKSITGSVTNNDRQCRKLADSLNYYAQGLYTEYSGYVASGWSSDKGAIQTLNKDITDYNSEVSAYNSKCDGRALPVGRA